MKSTLNKKKADKIHQKCIYKMICRSNPKEISRIEEFLQQVSKHLHIDDGMMYRLLVSCTEAVNNAIVHGNKSDPDKDVTIRCVVRDKNLTIYVQDEGSGFDSENLQDPRDKKNLMKENGRGVFLMRSLMDQVKFKRLKSGSVVEMKVKLH
ncbi:MAG: ATP-binding protein [Ignavibacteriales bacterium]|nr:ATP-binding protein [Ignavibacteriales bacterium]